MKKNIAAISLFSGCGGLDVGSHMAGVPVKICLELDGDCIQTLKSNKMFSDAKILQEDIANIKGKDLKKILNTDKTEKTIIIGGPPCQPFSKASYWVGHKRRKGVKDERNLISEYFRLIKEFKPDGFLMENVESIFHPKHREIIDTIEKLIQEMGYKYQIYRANALDFGVPQKRKRVFIFGSKKKFLKEFPTKTHFPSEICNGNGLKPHTNVGMFISKYDKKKYFEEYEVTDNKRYSKELREVPPGKNYIALSSNARYPNPKFIAGTKFWSFLLKLHPDLPSWTIAAQPGPWVGPFHWTSRRLRVPEISALQTFPEDFTFSGSRRSIQRQIGNAVPPLLAKSMIGYLKENILNEKK